jgi:hypothetical protein
LEAFQTASAGVTTWFEEQGRLATERPVLDDNGDGIGREAAESGPDGELAQSTHLQRDDPTAGTADAELAALLRQRADLQSRIERLRTARSDMPPDQYERELEALVLELARLDRQIRSKS